jgi:PleD family two-component response regulator
MMPGMNGFEMLEKVKKDDKTKEIPVVILSNLGQNEDIDKGMKLGAVDYIIKVHHTPAEIFERVSKLLKK